MPFINWSENIIKYRGVNLPHWFQPGTMQYITFRLNDSLPQIRLEQLNELKSNFISRHPQPWDENTKKNFYSMISPFESKLLDEGYGRCVLKNPVVRKCLSESLLSGDGERYDLLAYVIMPNHVHVLMTDIYGEDVNDIISSIQRFSATKINRLLGRRGKLWMRDDFDRMVRSLRHFQHCLWYIISNPKHLRPGEYELYINKDLYNSIIQENQ